MLTSQQHKIEIICQFKGPHIDGVLANSQQILDALLWHRKINTFFHWNRQTFYICSEASWNSGIAHPASNYMHLLSYYDASYHLYGWIVAFESSIVGELPVHFLKRPWSSLLKIIKNQVIICEHEVKIITHELRPSHSIFALIYCKKW